MNHFCPGTNKWRKYPAVACSMHHPSIDVPSATDEQLALIRADEREKILVYLRSFPHTTGWAWNVLHGIENGDHDNPKEDTA